MKYFLIFCSLLFITGNAFADEDIFADYKSDIRNDAQAKNKKFFKSKSDNLRYRIKHNLQKNGKIITYDANSGIDSLTGITIEEGAKTGDIIMDTKLGNNNTILFEERKY